jgi:hypothetical protein
MNQRIERALSQRIFCIEETWSATGLVCSVMGTTNILYQVRWEEKTGGNEGAGGGWQCTCPDFVRRQEPCKHIYFIMVRKLGFSVSDLRANENQEGLLSLQQLRDHKKQTTPVVQRPIESDQECAICYEPLVSKAFGAPPEPLVFCHTRCGNSIHAQCFAKWAVVKGKICVFCRSPM